MRYFGVAYVFFALLGSALLVGTLTHAQEGANVVPAPSPLTGQEFIQFHQKLFNIQSKRDARNFPSEAKSEDLEKECDDVRENIRLIIAQLSGKNLIRDNHVLFYASMWANLHGDMHCDPTKLKTLYESTGVMSPK